MTILVDVLCRWVLGLIIWMILGTFGMHFFDLALVHILGLGGLVEQFFLWAALIAWICAGLLYWMKDSDY